MSGGDHEASASDSGEVSDSLLRRHGSAKKPRTAPERTRPPGTTDASVTALGKLSEALEIVERARGLLYSFHQLCGSADLALQDAVRQIREAGFPELAEDLEQTLVGRDVIAGRWSYQLVESYDDGYWSVFRDAEVHARRMVLGPPGVAAGRHLLEAEMQRREQDRSAGPDQA